MSTHLNKKMEIDAVITWVDGDDEEFSKKRKSYTSNNNINESTNSTRFNQVDELSIAVKSIFKFAPFVRNIYILTDNQTPKIIKQSEQWKKSFQDRIKLVDHKEVFSNYLDVLPTFNSSTIETMLQYIDGLSEHFIYFNDDMFLIKPTKVEDWFFNGKPVIRGKWLIPPDKIWYKKIRNFFFPSKRKKFSFKRAQAISAKIEGFDKKYFRTYHSPRALNKIILKDYFNNNLKLLKDQIKYRFRKSSQFISYSLIWHYSIKMNLAIISNELCLQEINIRSNSNTKGILKKIQYAIDNNNILFLNIQSLDILDIDTLNSVNELLHDLTYIDLE